MTLENRVKKMEARIQTNAELDTEIEALLAKFSPTEQEALLAEFVRTHRFHDPSRLTAAERATNIFLMGGERLE